MFWDRNGYIPDYDTYLLGRAHVAGLRLRTKIFDLVYAKFGFGATAAEVLNDYRSVGPCP